MINTLNLESGFLSSFFWDKETFESIEKALEKCEEIEKESDVDRWISICQFKIPENCEDFSFKNCFQQNILLKQKIKKEQQKEEENQSGENFGCNVISIEDVYKENAMQ
ncbi:MAG: hypothetical protein ACOCV1_00640 [Bacillota bacterium]